LRRCVVVS